MDMVNADINALNALAGKLVPGPVTDVQLAQAAAASMAAAAAAANSGQQAGQDVQLQVKKRPHHINHHYTLKNPKQLGTKLGSESSSMPTDFQLKDHDPR